MAGSKRAPYPSDLTDEQWLLLEPLLPIYQSGRPPKTDRREVLNSISYVLESGCQWRMLPHDFGIKWTVAYDWFRRWRLNGTWQRIHDALRAPTRAALGHEHDEPSVVIIDSQTVKGAETTNESGYDGGKKTKGRKRHLAVDTCGLIVALVVTSAAVTDARGAEQCFAQAAICDNERLEVVYADQAYHRHALYEYLRQSEAHFRLEIVQRQPNQEGFEVAEKRWIVERTNSWIRRARRLAKDYERRVDSSESMIYLRGIRLMTKRIINTRSVKPNSPNLPKVA